MKTIEIEKIVDKFDLKIAFQNGIKGLIPTMHRKEFPQSIEIIKENKQEIINFIEKREMEKKEMEKKFISDMENEKIEINTIVVGCDYRVLTLTIDEKKYEKQYPGIDIFGIYYDYFSSRNLYEHLHRYDIKEGENITKKIFQIIAKKEAKKEVIKIEKDDNIQKLTKVAKETNKKQLLKSYTIECQDRNESCDMDTVSEYVMPDGEIKEEISHTW